MQRGWLRQETRRHEGGEMNLFEVLAIILQSAILITLAYINDKLKDKP